MSAACQMSSVEPARRPAPGARASGPGRAKAAAPAAPRMSDKLRKVTILPLLLAAASAGAGAVASEPALVRAPVERAGVDALEAPAPAPAAEAPRWLGPYRLLRELGTGGMGTVHLAESSGPRPRRVALKVIKDGPGAGELAAQFEVERRALGAVDHDFVARLYDGGTTTDGRPWIAMEYVEGEPITDYCDRRRLDLEARLRLFVDVCEAVQHLHERGVLHRDLKPANILVSERRGRPVPKLIDLGLARVRGLERGEAEGLVGTPAYMAPEQFTLSPRESDARGDVFALGVVLRELLVGARPGGRVPGGMLNAALRSLHAENPPPSAQLATLDAAPAIARRRATRLARLRRRLRGALDRIAQRASEGRPEVRYASVAALAADLERDLRRHEAWRRSLRLLLLTGAAAAAGLACGLVV